jgi:hypothetical protein
MQPDNVSEQVVTMRNLLILAVLLTSGGAAAEVYKSVDEHGNVEFSDQASPGAELIEVEELQTIEAPPPPSILTPPAQSEPVSFYTRVAVVSPAHDEAVRQNDGNITVSVIVEPMLSPGDHIALFLDGQEIAAAASTSIPLENIDRGTHQLQVEVRAANGTVRIRSESVTFHLLRHAIPRPQPGGGKSPASAGRPGS